MSSPATAARKVPRSPAVNKDEPAKQHNVAVAPQLEEVTMIAPITTYNEWVVIQPFNLATDILLPSNVDYRNVGIVVGKSDTVMAPNGERVSSVLNYGDVVLFQKKSVVGDMFISKEPYLGKRLVMLSERNVICKLPSIPFKILAESIGAEAFEDETMKK